MRYLTFTSLLILLAFSILETSAQTQRNIIYRCAKGDISYTEPVQQKQSTSKAVGSILGSLLELSAGQTTSTENHPEYADAIRSAITGAIGSARRINVIDGMFMPGELSADEPALYFDGSISSISTTRRLRTWEDNQKKVHEDTEYKGNITATINIKDAHTDAVVKSISVNSSSYSEYWLATSDKALGYTIDNMKAQIINALNYAYPLYASIVESATAKKDKQKEVYIDLGAPSGVYSGLHFTVYTVQTIAGKEAKKEIGRLKISEVMGDEISLCKVIRGGKDVKEAIDNGATLLITSRE